MSTTSIDPAIQEALEISEYEFDLSLEPERQTDKDDWKLVPCRECKRPLLVNRFYSAANARCSSCKATNATERGSGRASVAVPQAGRTDPAKAVRLEDCLVNPTFAACRCPVHPDNDEHVMVLKWVSHSDAYGPSELVGAKNGRPDYRQSAIGETVLYQCDHCKATVSYSTTAQMQLQRQNEVRNDRHVNGWVKWLGTNEAPPS